MNPERKAFIIGIVVGILSPPLAFYIFCTLSFADISVWDQFMSYYRRNVASHVVSLSLIINLALFFLFISLNRDQSARGILGATFLFGILILILKFT